MTHDRFEYLLSQYLDGELSPAKRAYVEKKIAEDPNAWTQLREYAQLNAGLQSALPLPPIDWNANARRISAAIAQLPPPAPVRISILRPWIFAAALAACLLLGFTLLLNLRAQPAPQNSLPPSDEIARADITGPAVESPAGDPVAEVTLDAPPPGSASAARFSDAIVAQPSRVSIISAMLPGDQPPHWEPK
jgi:anti-sigma factor RsiW